MVKTTYFWDEETDNVLMESDDQGNVTQYTQYTQKPEPYGKVLSQNRNGTKSYYHYDAQGSVRQVTNSTGTVTDSMTYTAFGETVAKTGSTVNPSGYKGALGYYTNPTTEDLYVRARTLKPELGRWLSEDPLGVDNESNLYLFVENNPGNYFDPTGLFCVRFDGNIPTTKQRASTCPGSTKAFPGSKHLWERERGDPIFIVQRVEVSGRFSCHGKKTQGTQMSLSWEFRWFEIWKLGVKEGDNFRRDNHASGPFNAANFVKKQCGEPCECGRQCGEWTYRNQARFSVRPLRLTSPEFRVNSYFFRSVPLGSNTTINATLGVMCEQDEQFQPMYPQKGRVISQQAANTLDRDFQSQCTSTDTWTASYDPAQDGATWEVAYKTTGYSCRCTA